MKKISYLLSAALIATFVSSITAPVQAQSDEYSRLYEEFLKRLQQEQNSDTETTPTTSTPAQEIKPTTTAPKPEVVKAQPKVKTDMYSVTGRITRSTDGRYFISTDEKPSRNLRVYGQELSKEIIQSVVYDSVQLIGEKAYFNGKEVGISVRKLVPLSGGKEAMTTMTTKTTPATVTPKPEPTKTPIYHQEMNFMGEIEISSEGNPFLVMTENKKRFTHRLLNSADWKKAFQNAYKGSVKVRGYMTEAGAIRYSEITR
jgi:hypothetical protein